jgi:threonine dehydrogenase-like Zn-dependent dehydrogenase
MVEYSLVTDLQAMVDDGLTPPYSPDRTPTRKIPSSISMEDAALLLTVKEIFTAIRNFGFKPGMDVLVYGDGPVGFGLCLFLRRLQAGRVCCVGHHQERLEKILREASVDQIVNSHDETVEKALEGQKFDLVIDAVGKTAILTQGASLLRPGGKVALYGVPSPHDSIVNLLDFPTHCSIHIQYFPYREHDCQDEIVEMVTSGQLDLKTFYTHVLPADEISRAVTMMRDRTAYKIVMKMSE